MRQFAGVLLLLFVTSGIATSVAETRDPESHFFNETFGDFSEELATAREEGKKGVLIFFEMDECPFCHYMKTNILNRPEVQEYYRNNFLIFSVDIEGDIAITDFKGNTMSQKDFAFKVNRVRATPVIAFYDLNGDQILRYTGRVSGVDEFMWMGEFIVDEHYKKKRFSNFKREKRKEKRGP